MEKEQVHKVIVTHIQQRINGLNEILKETFESTANDSKSSAGDKHETAIAMVQLEQEKLTKQINEFLTLRETLLKINQSKKHIKIELGSLVETNKGWYYFSIGIGAVQFNDTTIFCLNPLAPLGQLLEGKTVGDSVEFNGNVTTIILVC